MQRIRRFGKVMVSLGVICALCAGGAAARSRLPSLTTYKVVYEGSGTYAVDQTDGPSFGKIKSGFHWKVTYTLAFFHKANQEVTGFAPKPTGGGDWSIVSDNGGGDQCSRSGGLKPTPNAIITGRVQPTGGVVMRVVPGGGSDFTTTNGSAGSEACDTTDFWHDWVTSFSHIGGDDDVDPLTAFVHLSKAEQRAGKVIIKVSNSTLAAPSLTANPDCGSGDGASCTQSFDWKGTVTFVKKKTRRF